jgi:hypothetical protein
LRFYLKIGAAGSSETPVHRLYDSSTLMMEEGDYSKRKYLPDYTASHHRRQQAYASQVELSVCLVPTVYQTLKTYGGVEVKKLRGF